MQLEDYFPHAHFLHKKVDLATPDVLVGIHAEYNMVTFQLPFCNSRGQILQQCGARVAEIVDLS